MYLRQGTCSLDETLDPNAWLLAAKVVEKFEQVNRKSMFRDDWSPCNEPNMHECNIGILTLVLPHGHSG